MEYFCEQKDLVFFYQFDATNDHSFAPRRTGMSTNSYTKSRKKNRS